MKLYQARFLGLVAYYVTSLLYKTLRVRLEMHPEYDPKQQYFGAFWHGKQLLPVLSLTREPHQTKQAVLVSPSRDGEILTTCLKKLGYEVMRGSSRQNNIGALSQMVRKLKDGYSLGFGIDGPIGPIYKVKPGMTHLAQKFGIGIIPIGSAFSRKWVIHKAWDKFEIPKPFSKAVIYLGRPLTVPKSAELEDINLQLEQAIHAAERHAEIAILC